MSKDGKRVNKKIEFNIKNAQEKLGIGVSFDLILKELNIGGKKSVLLFIDGFAKDDIMFWLLQHLLKINRQDLIVNTIDKLLHKEIAYLEVELEDNLDKLYLAVLSGSLILFMDGETSALIIDAREYPARSPEEPDIERVTRGSRDGFVETLIFNTALIRRRIRDPGLRIELFQVGKRSVTDIALVYINDIANPDLTQKIKNAITKIEIDGLPMAEKTLEEFLVKGNWNPFPQVRYTERPDVAAVHILEGHVAIIVDTSPSVILAPATLFHHLQHAEEYRQNAAVGAYLRWVRFLGVIISLFLPAVWLTMVTQRTVLPPSLEFLGPKESGNIPLGIQFLAAELGLDLIRMASIHTPSPLATALGLIAAFMIGEIAIKVGLFSSEVIMYLSIAAIGGFATPSYELSLAIRIWRLLLLILVFLFKLPGLVGGTVLLFLLLITTNSFGFPYLWPLIPFNLKALWDIFLRRPVPLKNFRPNLLRTIDPDRRQESKK